MRHGQVPTDFRRPADRWVAARCTDAVIDLLVEGGIQRLSLNAIARDSNWTPAGLHARIGGRAGLIAAVIGCFADRWVRTVANEWSNPAGICWLPRDAGGREGTSCWLALNELAAGEARAGRTQAQAAVASARRDEVNYVAWALSRSLGRRAHHAEAVALFALGEGLRSAIIAPENPLPVEAAQEILVNAVDQLRRAAAA